MFPFGNEPTKLEMAVDRALDKLSEQEVGSTEYSKTLDAVTKLHDMKVEDLPHPVSKDTVLLVSANLLGIMMIIRHEHVNVITSRAMGLLRPPK